MCSASSAQIHVCTSTVGSATCYGALSLYTLAGPSLQTADREEIRGVGGGLQDGEGVGGTMVPHKNNK